MTVAAPATAADCTGSLTVYGKNSTGELPVYYSTASGGTNCAKMTHLGSTYGVSSQTSVGIVKCTQTSMSASCTVSGTWATDSGSYAYYAGPVTRTSTNGKCVAARGKHAGLDWSTRVNGAGSYNSPAAVSCG